MRDVLILLVHLIVMVVPGATWWSTVGNCRLVFGLAAEVVAAIVEIGRSIPRFGHRQIADHMTVAFDIHVD
ncbi:MAG TPA: hypothetical protein VK854_12935 [Woeseiaceae bacterium]|nr:hypothetical protein [Woeseiaceae bacterium]